MDQDQNPQRVARYLIDKTIAAVRGQFARSGDLAHMAEHRKVGKLGNGIAEQLIDAQRRGRVPIREIFPDCGAILLSFRRLDDLHA